MYPLAFNYHLIQESILRLQRQLEKTMYPYSFIYTPSLLIKQLLRKTLLFHKNLRALELPKKEIMRNNVSDNSTPTYIAIKLPPKKRFKDSKIENIRKPLRTV